MPQENGAEWLAESLRATAFPAEPVDLDSIAWWTDMVKEAPAKSTREPRKGVLEERGPYEGNELILRVQPERVDWILTPVKEEHEDFPPVLGSVTDTVGPFRRFIVDWLESLDSPDIERLAFAAVLLKPVSDVEEGYRNLAAYLPAVTISADKSRSFLYQINRPRESECEIEGLEINRLSKWSVQKVLQQRVSVSQDRAQVVPGETCTACRLEVDVNTAAEYQRSLPCTKLPDLFTELVELADEIAKKGDIP